MSISDPNEREKKTSESTSDSTEPQDRYVRSGQTFQVREGDRIVIDKKKFFPSFTVYKRRTIISINKK
jgi:hypothetical protein